MLRLLCLFLIFVCADNFAQQDQKADFEKLRWVEGVWIRTNTKAGRIAHERWMTNGDNELIGFGVTMKGTDTLFFEKMKIVSRKDGIFYVADVPENKAPIDFRITEISINGFTCENPEHDFPKKITYQKDGSKMRANTSGNGKSIDFLFEKAEEKKLDK
jgi:hypothetical protein